MPETRVVVVGGTAGVKDVLLHHSLRNTVHGLYLALHDLTLHTPPRTGNSRLKKILPKEAASVSERVWVYRRCLYCNNGKADVQLIHKWNLTSSPQHVDDLFFGGQFRNFNGHKIRFSALRFLPYNDYTPDSKEPGSTATFRDCLDARLLSVLALKLNFSLEVREQPQRTWGTNKDGKTTGMLRQLQREEIDIGGAMGSQTYRMEVALFLRAYKADVLSIVSLKPTLLPQHLSVIRPFSGELWLLLSVSVVLWGVTLWLQQRVWRWFAGGQGVKLTTALLHSLGTLLERPPSNPSDNDSGRLLIGWWLVFCLVITTGFRSSLIAHLTVQGKSPPPETFEDLVARSNWKWGIEHWMMRGMPRQYFTQHTHPVVRKINKEMQVLTAAEGLDKVKKGSYSLFSPSYHITIVINSNYTDNFGQTPFYISKDGIVGLAAIGWSLRKGVPYFQRLQQLISQLEDAGIIPHWTGDIIAGRVKENRAAATLQQQAALAITVHEDDTKLVLGLHHLQGAFYLLFLGCTIAYLTLLVENFAHSRSWSL
ncbi:Glutamate receptor ionotropic, delta-1-like 35 [Homarus americanus]|uniref:Glutamate receptor ionotropic, delta-1-like 35 n=3 Tax=Homarus americanus TaxID=6706 RepID=A0A8J5JR93_HOMAM|nr:Glutamate receptor ionotropic, delta-1-like 35 [Homarus americanus]